MGTRFIALAFAALLAGAPPCAFAQAEGRVDKMASSKTETAIALPSPQHDGKVSLEAALLNRRSVREFSTEPLTLADLSQLLWAGQGITDPRGFRTAPSAGALYPLQLHAVVGNAASIEPGIFRYDPQRHQMLRTVEGDRRPALAAASFGQFCVQNGPLSIVVTAIPKRLAPKYGDRAERYAFMEAGHAAQNILLQAVSLDLAAVPVGAFRDDELAKALDLPEGEKPLYVITIGKPEPRNGILGAAPPNQSAR